MVSEAETLRPPVVLLDANLLYPFHLRNLLVQFAVERQNLRVTTPEISSYIDTLEQQRLEAFAARLRR